MARAETILRLSGRIYDSVRDPAAWRPALAAIMESVGGADTGLMAMQDVPSNSVDVIANIDVDTAVQARATKVIVSDGWPSFLLNLSAGRARSSDSLIDDRTLEASAYYNDILRPRGAFHGLLLQPQQTSKLITYLSIYRRRQAEAFGPAEVATLQALVSHLAAALELHHRLREADLRAAGAFRALDHVSAGVILTDAAGQPCFINTAAQVILDESDGLRLAPGGLTAATARETEMLRLSLARVATPATAGTLSDNHAGCHLHLRRPSGRPALAARVLPVCRLDLPVPGRLQPAVALFIRAPDKPRSLDVSFLVATYDLTPREAELAVLLSRGVTLADATRQLKLRPDTTRTYLKRALDKTGTHRQAELVSLVLRSCAEP